MAIVQEYTSRGLRTLDIEIALAEYFGIRQNLVVPNVSWGAFIHECDLLILTKAGYAWEVEIKVSRADLKRDGLKRHGHIDRQDRIKSLFYAVPSHLLPIDEFVPARAGILAVSGHDRYYHVQTVRQPQISRTARPWSESERYNIARLGSMRIWTLKRNIVRLREEISKSVIADTFGKENEKAA